VADEKATEVAQVSEGALDFPAFGVAAHGAAFIEGRAAPFPAMRTEQDDPALKQTPAQRVAVVSAIGDYSQGAALWASAPGARDGDARQSRFCQGYFGWAGGTELASQRNTLAVRHHHPLCTFATFGFTHAEPPFLAGAKLPSRNTSSQLSLPWASSCPSKVRQIFNQTSRSSQARRRRQQVLAEGYSAGRSRQRAPLRKTHKMPSKTRRWSAGGRPRWRRRGLGKNGPIFCHCSSLSKDRSRIPRVPHHSRSSYKQKMWPRKIHRLPW
jgi:hypothetical protein